MAEVPEPRHHQVLVGVAITVVLVLTAARIHFGRGQIPGGLLVGCVAVIAVVAVVFKISAYRTYGRGRPDR